MSAEGTEGTGQALFSFVRHWSRRWSGPDDMEREDRGREVLAVETVVALAGREEVTVNDVAAELGFDQSNASRLLAHAIDAGYLTGRRSMTDQRRRTVKLTPSGQQLLEAAHAWQDQAFAMLTVDWTPDERKVFRQAMRRLIASSSALDHV